MRLLARLPAAALDESHHLSLQLAHLALARRRRRRKIFAWTRAALDVLRRRAARRAHHAAAHVRGRQSVAGGPGSAPRLVELALPFRAVAAAEGDRARILGGVGHLEILPRPRRQLRARDRDVDHPALGARDPERALVLAAVGDVERRAALREELLRDPDIVSGGPGGLVRRGARDGLVGVEGGAGAERVRDRRRRLRIVRRRPGPVVLGPRHARRLGRVREEGGRLALGQRGLVRAWPGSIDVVGLDVGEVGARRRVLDANLPRERLADRRLHPPLLRVDRDPLEHTLAAPLVLLPVLLAVAPVRLRLRVAVRLARRRLRREPLVLAVPPPLLVRPRLVRPAHALLLLPLRALLPRRARKIGVHLLERRGGARLRAQPLELALPEHVAVRQSVEQRLRRRHRGFFWRAAGRRRTRHGGGRAQLRGRGATRDGDRDLVVWHGKKLILADKFSQLSVGYSDSVRPRRPRA